MLIDSPSLLPEHNWVCLFLQAAVSYPLATGPPAYSQAPPPIGFSADPTEGINHCKYLVLTPMSVKWKFVLNVSVFVQQRKFCRIPQQLVLTPPILHPSKVSCNYQLLMTGLSPLFCCRCRAEPAIPQLRDILSFCQHSFTFFVPVVCVTRFNNSSLHLIM